MNRTFCYEIKENENGMRLLDYLRANGYSRNILSAMKSDKGAISLNGSRGFGKDILRTGDHLVIRLLETEGSDHIPPVKMDLKILYEDEDLLVINKDANVPIHPSMGNYENTLANGVAYYLQSESDSFVYRCINRLDRDTTGALIIAKNGLSAAILSSQMKQRGIRRTYLALVEGFPPEGGTIDAPIARVCDSVMEREVNPQAGETAVTHFKRLAYNGQGLSLMELHLETGRTHQIRVHMKHIGYPLPGDYLYHPTYDKISRQPLHSFQLEFIHPVTKKEMLITAPVPEDFLAAWKAE